MSNIQDKANAHYQAIVKQIAEINKISFDLATGEKDWGDIGSLAHIRNGLADILEGWNEDKTFRAK